jgi:hypothetical protein
MVLLSSLRVFAIIATVFVADAASAQQGSGKPAPALHEIAFAADGRAFLSTQVTSNKFAEWCGRLAAGDRVEWTYRSSQPLDMNVHYHEGKSAVYPVKVTAENSSAGSLKVEAEKDYCWMWTNKTDASVSIEAELRRAR